MLTKLWAAKEWVKAKLVKDERGQGLVEYGLIIALVAIAVIGGLLALNGQLNDIFADITNGLQGQNP